MNTTLINHLWDAVQKHEYRVEQVNTYGDDAVDDGYLKSTLGKRQGLLDAALDVHGLYDREGSLESAIYTIGHCYYCTDEPMEKRVLKNSFFAMFDIEDKHY